MCFPCFPLSSLVGFVHLKTYQGKVCECEQMPPESRLILQKQAAIHKEERVLISGWETHGGWRIPSFEVYFWQVKLRYSGCEFLRGLKILTFYNWPQCILDWYSFIYCSKQMHSLEEFPYLLQKDLGTQITHMSLSSRLKPWQRAACYPHWYFIWWKANIYNQLSACKLMPDVLLSPATQKPLEAFFTTLVWDKRPSYIIYVWFCRTQENFL